MIIKKIFIAIALTLLLMPNIEAKEPFTTHKVVEFYNRALNEKNETALFRISNFIEATGDGVTTTNAYFGARGKGMLFFVLKRVY